MPDRFDGNESSIRFQCLKGLYQTIAIICFINIDFRWLGIQKNEAWKEFIPVLESDTSIY
jgi:hypothetical protein